MSDFLSEMARSSRARVDAADTPLDRLRQSSGPARGLPDGFLVIAEIKPVSPSAGVLAGSGFLERLGEYERGGASAVSVLTEPERFGGSLQLLADVASATDLPVMRKDFIVDPYQVWEAAACSASGVLAIVRLVDDNTLRSIVAAGRQAGLFVLVEVFDQTDLDRVAGLDPDDGNLLLGVNARDLETLAVDPDAHARLAPSLPEGWVAIAESGVATPGQVREVRDMGYGGILTGTALMRSPHPAAAVAGLVAAGEA